MVTTGGSMHGSESATGGGLVLRRVRWVYKLIDQEFVFVANQVVKLSTKNTTFGLFVYERRIMMNKLSTKNLCEIALLTALYCVLSAMMKIPFIGAISLDLGYVALAIGCVVFGMWGAFVGAVGCGIESILFSPYGFSIGWFVANLIVGLGCGYVFTHTESTWKRIVAIIIFVGIGMLGAKTLIECTLYGIPFEVKIIKSLVAFGIDSITMILGLFIAKRICK